MSAFDSVCVSVCALLTGSSMLAMARQTFSKARLAPTAEGTGTVEAGPLNSWIWKSKNTSAESCVNTSRNKTDKKRLKSDTLKSAWGGSDVIIMDWIYKALFIEPIIHSHSVTTVTSMLRMSSTLVALNVLTSYQVIVASAGGHDIRHRPVSLPHERHELKDDSTVMLHLVH